MGHKLLLISSLFITLLPLINCARILIVLPTPLYSHNLVYRAVYRELALRGHELVVFTTDPLDDPRLPNLVEIDTRFLYEYPAEENLFEATRAIFAHPEMRRIINDTGERFDMVMTEWSVNPSFGVLSKRFDCPLVGIRALGLRLEGHDSVGNPTNPSYLPVGHGDFENTFFGRLDNFLFSIVWRVHYHLVVVPEAQRIADEFLPQYSDSDVLEIEKNVSIVLTNTHPVITGVRPLVPAVIEIGGVHLKKEPKEMPKEVEEYLDSAKQGVVYLNLGSNAKGFTLDSYVLKTIVSALSELPYKVIWRWDNSQLPNPPLNVKVWKWLPQEAVLGHPNVKAFITNGGLQSFLEAVDNRVPLVGIPLFADQFINVRQMEKLKIGKRLDVRHLTKSALVSAVKNVIRNPKYKRNINKISVLLHDLPMKPLDKAVWWVEYVLRHKGARHLRSAAVDLDWITYLLLDVIAFFIACLIALIMLLYYAVKYLWRLVKWLKKRVTKEKVH